MRAQNQPSADDAPLAHRHFRFGWTSLVVYAVLGLVLDALHAFKVSWYVDAAAEPRRLMWTLAHAHGIGLALVHIAFAASLPVWPPAGRARLGLASTCLVAASLALPGGFFLGGLFVYGGDPGAGVLLVPVGGALLLVALGFLARPWWATVADTKGSTAAPDEGRRARR